MKTARKDYLTATDFYQFAQCPHWPYYERFATKEEQTKKREMTTAELTRLEHGIAHEAEVVAKIMEGQAVSEVKMTGDAVKDCEVTLDLMKQGVPVIYQGTITHGDWTGRPDILERREGESSFGAWYYVPIDVKSTHYLEKYQKLQLTFYASILEHLQGVFPSEPAIVNRDGERIPFDASQMILELESFVVELERIRAGEKPAPILRKSCFDTGPWGEVCQAYAEATNDIALLFNVNIEKLRALRSLGVHTVSDAAEMDPITLDGAAKGLRLHGLEVAKRQAQSLLSDQVIVREPVAFEEKGLEIHFDIESDPPHDVDYLYGFFVRRPEGEEYVSFVADQLDGEEKMWRDFLSWLETLPPVYTVYHFSPYESTRLFVLEKRYGGSTYLELFRASMIDLKEIVTHSITYPLYFYGLKYICKFLGFSWRSEVTGGGQSVDVFEQFLETRERRLLDAIILYNEDDVRATAFLKDWLVKYAKEITSYEKPYPWE